MLTCAWVPVACIDALTCHSYDHTGHTPSALREFESAKRQAESFSWLMPMLVGVAGGLVVGLGLHRVKRQCCSCCGRGRGSEYKQVETDVETASQ